ncbi:hypothetical protein OS493_018114 [Desmophyllum pertusum]|uniref:Uncharacterized protein n=1 Tax=Desmophyllum pertusum TaxID=174260 RepID=A0A9X0CLR5_9CNID|nr:hypothetical protein OS493_018114 [Desmophyllum pertusum]
MSSTTDEHDEPQVLLSSTEVQFSEPPTDVTYHLEYPYNLTKVEDGNDTHIKEDGIVPAFKSPSVDHDMADVSALLEAPHEDSAGDLLPGDQESRTYPTWDIQAHSFETVYNVTIPDNPTMDGDSLEIQEHSPTVVSRTVKRTTPIITSGDDELEEETHFFTSTTEVQFSEPPTDVTYHLEYPYNLTKVEDGNDTHIKEDGIVPAFKSPSVDHDMADVSALLEAPHEDSAGDLLPGDQESRTYPTWDIQAHSFETVYNVTIPDNPTMDGDSLEIQEHSPTVVSRTVKRTTPIITSGDDELEEETHFFTSTTEVQFSEPPTDVTYHLEYPYNLTKVEDGNDTHIKEDGIVPAFKSPSVDHDMADVSALLEAPHEDSAGDLLPGDQESRTYPTWDIQAHSFETVYNVTIPDNPTMDGGSLEIQEHSPTVVSRTVKRTTPIITSGDDELEEETHFFTSTTEVQFSEPSNDFQLEYPETNKVLTTDQQNVNLTDEEWISRHAVEKKTSDISALLAAFDHPKEEAQPSSDSRRSTKDGEKSPREKSPKDIVRRGSNSRLWDLMQGYLIEEPILDDGEANAKSESERTVEVKVKEEPKLEIAMSVRRAESSVYEVIQQPTVSKKESTKEIIKSVPKVESGVPEVLQPPMKMVAYQIQIDDQEPSKQVITSITKAESNVSEVTAKASKFDSVTFHVDTGDKRPVAKEQPTSSWRKQTSAPVDVDDKDDDPWMRHYSKGLQRGFSYQPATTKSPESESSFDQSPSLSLSKVPHVRGIKTSGEKERERSRYTIEGRTRAEPTAYRGTTEWKSLPRDLEAVPRVRTHESVFSIRDDKDKSPKSQTRTTRGDSPRGTSSGNPSVQSLRSLWDK